MHAEPCREDKVFHSYHMDNTTNEAKQQELDSTIGNPKIEEVSAPIEDQEQDSHHDELHQLEDLSGLGKEELLKRMEETFSNPDPDQIKGTIQKLKDTFRELVREEMEAKRRAWEEHKESEDDKFEPAPDFVADKFEEYLKKYNQKRTELRRSRDTEQRKNLANKMALVDELKALAESSESMNKAFEKLQALQSRYREIGPVPSTDVEELRKVWQHHLDRFFDVVKISRELRELDFKKNQDLKNELIAKAEALKEEPSVRRALDQLHLFHEQWREIGPAPKELNDQLWDQFKVASDKTYARKQVLLEDNKAKQVENLAAKIALCEKMDVDAEKVFDSHKNWQEANNAVEALFEEWRKIGHVPKDDEEKTWKRFKESRQKFFRNRETYYAQQRDDFKKNLAEKVALCEKAESLKISTDWKGTAMQFKRMQDDWKKIGPVPRKVSEKIWFRFKAAADAFFENRNKQFAAADALLKENIVEREALIAEANDANLGEDLLSARTALGELQKRWNEMKPAPRNDFERLENAWKKVQEKLLLQLKEKGGDENTLQRIKYDQLKQTEKGRDQIYRERSVIQEKIKKIQSEITTIENNLGMFSKSKGAQSLVADYQAQVEKHKDEVAKLKAQLKQIPRE
ncbi:MAG: DUF349 domain-containing protein [Bacteroidetes bacterium]|nr:DUF349 domain-containing protein [Bacteroidota bacterium]